MATYIRINDSLHEWIGHAGSKHIENCYEKNHSSALLIHLYEIFSGYLTLLIYNVFCNSIENTHVIIFTEGGPPKALTPAEEAMA